MTLLLKSYTYFISCDFCQYTFSSVWVLHLITVDRNNQIRIRGCRVADCSPDVIMWELRVKTTVGWRKQYVVSSIFDDDKNALWYDLVFRRLGPRVINARVIHRRIRSKQGGVDDDSEGGESGCCFAWAINFTPQRDWSSYSSCNCYNYLWPLAGNQH